MDSPLSFGERPQDLAQGIHSPTQAPAARSGDLPAVSDGRRQEPRGGRKSRRVLPPGSPQWPEAEPVHRSAVTKARAKLSWTAFEPPHHDAVRLVYEAWPASEADTWRGLSVYALDGSKYTVPASDALRAAFDPDSGLDQPGKGHDPRFPVSTVHDVFRRLPIARTIRSMAEANEREEVKVLLPHIPSGGVLLFDRGYPSYDLIDYVSRHYPGYWLSRPVDLSRRRSLRSLRSGSGSDHPETSSDRSHHPARRPPAESRRNDLRLADPSLR